MLTLICRASLSSLAQKNARIIFIAGAIKLRTRELPLLMQERRNRGIWLCEDNASLNEEEEEGRKRGGEGEFRHRVKYYTGPDKNEVIFSRILWQIGMLHIGHPVPYVRGH